ncbi:hypothetical protein J6590_073605 [Homalodisca vitripennis]|nr:hypothetical protein J6590_073605 [Homalodisca vitripennis]
MVLEHSLQSQGDTSHYNFLYLIGSEPHPASARPYQASLTKNVLPLERSGARLTEREQGKAKKERGWPAIENLSSPPWHRCKDPAQESWERRTLELELVNPASTECFYSLSC